MLIVKIRPVVHPSWSDFYLDLLLDNKRYDFVISTLNEVFWFVDSVNLMSF